MKDMMLNKAATDPPCASHSVSMDVPSSLMQPHPNAVLQVD